MALPALDMKEFGLLRSVASGAAQTSRQKCELPGIQRQIRFAMTKAQLSMEQADDLRGLAVQIKLLAAIDFARVGAKKRIVHQYSHLERGIPRIDAGNQRRFKIIELDAGE